MRLRLACGALIGAVALAACAGRAPSSGASGAALPQLLAPDSGSSSKYVQHVIIMIQENRSFNDLFATFPGALGATTGKNSKGQTIALAEVSLNFKCDLGHSWKGFVRDYDGGKMDGFNLEGGNTVCPGLAHKKPYQYVNPAQLKPYWQIAKQYVLADHMFQTQGSGSFTAHQDLIRGDTAINATESVVDYPSGTPWGCDASPGTKTSLLKPFPSPSQPYVLKRLYLKGPFPCFTYPTLRDLLDAKGVTWKYYSPPVASGTSGGLWNAFDAIKVVRYGPEWYSNVTSSEMQIFTDIAHHRLAAVSWVIPDAINSDHPGNGSDTGPAWVGSVVNAIGKSSYWNSTAVIVVWDDWGGFYDSVPPPFLDRKGGLGFRVPMLIVSPYARQSGSGPGYISHTQYEFGSILKFIEDVWGLGQLGTTDKRATSISDCFDFTQPPRKFVPIAIPRRYKGDYFERQAPSYKPVDTE